MAPTITIVVATHQRPELIRWTLKSLLDCKLPPSYGELVVIENGSRDGTEVLVNALPERLHGRYMHVARGNKSNALNKALETIEDSLVVFTDDDVRLEPGVLTAYAEAAKNIGRGVFFGGSCGVDYEIPPEDWLKPLLPYSARDIHLHPDSSFTEFLGYNWAAYAEDIRELGGFDPNYGPGSPLNCTGQETEMQARMLAAGMRAQPVPEAYVWHHVPKRMTTPQWAVGRRFRDGVRQGQDLRRASDQAGLAEAIWKSGRFLLSVGKRSLLMDRPGWWRAAHALSLNLGKIYGFARARNEG